jgi:SET domain-containing protein
MWSLAPVAFRGSPIEGQGVFARRPFEPGEIIVPYAPKQRRVAVTDPAAVAAAETKLTLLSEDWWVIIPDTSVPGGYLCNHSCEPNAALYSDGEGRIQCVRPIRPGQEVTIFYGWVTRNQPERDPCRCGAPGCRGFINFDLSDDEVQSFETDTEAGRAFQRKVDDYAEYLRSIGRLRVLDLIADRLAQARSKLG